MTTSLPIELPEEAKHAAELRGDALIDYWDLTPEGHEVEEVEVEIVRAALGVLTAAQLRKLASHLMSEADREALVEEALRAVDAADVSGVGVVALTRTGVVRTVVDVAFPGRDQ